MTSPLPRAWQITPDMLRDLREQFLAEYPSAARAGVVIDTALLLWADLARTEGWTNMEAWAAAEHQRGLQIITEAKSRRTS